MFYLGVPQINVVQDGDIETSLLIYVVKAKRTQEV